MVNYLMGVTSRLDKENMNKVVDCAMDLQRLSLKNVPAKDMVEELKDKYTPEEVMHAMKLIDASQHDDRSPYYQVTKDLDRIVRTNGNFDRQVNTVDEFYDMGIDMYKAVMKDEAVKGLPILFMYVQGGKVGVAPIIGEITGNESPADSVKKILYQADPEAYLFCSEASSVAIKDTNKEELENNYEYGDIGKGKHGKSKDIVICKGNNRKNTTPFFKMYNEDMSKEQNIPKGTWTSDKF